MASNGQQKIYDMVTDRILASLEEGTVPWHKPWRNRGGHRNLITKRQYRGINQWLLELTAIEQEYALPYWLSYKQAEEKGGQVRKGEKSTMVVFWKPLTVADMDKDDKPTEKTIWMVRYYRVFNVEQCDDIEAPVDEEKDFDPIEDAEAVYPGMPNPPPLKHGGDRAFYAPSQDRVQLPWRGQFHSALDYYSTLWHELGHSTGHKSRLNRKEIEERKDPDDYPKEELTAEMTAAMISGIVGIDLKPRHENTAAYIQSWLKCLGRDKRLVVQAASRAHRAADFILNVQNGNGTE